MKRIIFILVIIIFLIGCTNEEEISPTEDNSVVISPNEEKISSTEDNNVIISPSELFVGDTKKLESHMDLITGAVRVDYSGDKKYIGTKYEIWENGETIDKNVILSSLIKNGFNGELSFSIKNLINDELKTMESMKMTSVISTDNGYSKSSTYIDKRPTGYSYGPTELDEEIKVQDDEDIIIWGVGASENGYSSYNDIERTLVEADWALVLMLEFKDDIKKE
jgi:hypothetical protein